MSAHRHVYHALVVLRALILIAIGLVLLPYALVPIYSVVDPVSTLMAWRWITGQRVERVFTPLDRMGTALPLAVIIAEDSRYCRHNGVDMQELQEAIEDASEGGEPRGGSTITQQTAKNLFLWPGRSYVRKTLEFPLALWLDLALSKRRVLEIYLNIAEWGPNGEFGAEAAALRDFGKPVAFLAPREAAMLASALPNPYLRDPRSPNAVVRRLGVIYQARAARAAYVADCLWPRPQP